MTPEELQELEARLYVDGYGFVFAILRKHGYDPERVFHAESTPEHPDTPRSSPGTSPHSPSEHPNDTASTAPSTEPSPRQDP